MSTDELIKAPVRGQVSPTARWVRRITAFAVAAFFGGYGMLEVWRPAPRLRLVGIERRALDKARRDANFWDGSLAALVEQRLGTGGHLRASVVPYWSALLFAAEMSSSPEVIVGKDGWIFLRDRAVIEESKMRSGVSLTANIYAAISRRLARHGSELVTLPIPRKSTVCAEMLPRGIDARSDFDDWLFDRLKSVGVRVVDSREEWSQLVVSDRYQRLDSHWARGARLALAREVCRQVPELKRKKAPLWFEEAGRKNTAGLLEHLGIPIGHSAMASFLDPPQRLVELHPESLVARIEAEDPGDDILMVGSSFTAGYDLHAMISGLAQAEIKDKSIRGERPMTLLGAELERRGKDRLPFLTLCEFPLNYVATFSGRNRAAMKPVLASFLAAPPLSVWSKPKFESIRLFSAKPQVRKPHLWLGRGTVLSSGSGCVAVEVTVTSKGIAQWRVGGGGFTFDVETIAGTSKLSFPIIENDVIEGRFYLMPLDSAAVNADASIRVVLESPQELAVPLPGTRDDQHWFSSKPFDAARFDSLLVEWNGASPEMIIRLHATDKVTEQERVVETNFRPSISGFFVLDLSSVTGCRVNSIELPAQLADLQCTLLREAE